MAEISTQELRSTQQAVEGLLEELGVRAFLYTIDQKDAGWTLNIECAVDGGWQTKVLPLDPHALAASLRDPELRARLREDWQSRLRSCAT
jgi:hypothetical protein